MRLNFLKEKIRLSRIHWIIIGFSFLILVSFFLISKENYKKSFSFLGEWQYPFLVNRVFKGIEKDFFKPGELDLITVGEDVVAWEELSQALDFEKAIWNNVSGDWQITGLVFEKEFEKQKIINLLIERKIVNQMAEKYGISDLVEEEIELAKVKSFGKNYAKLVFGSHPEMETRSRTRALKEKLDKELVRKYTGALIYVKFKSLGALELEGKEINSQELAKQKTEELHSLAAKEVSISEILEIAKNDLAVQKLNSGAEMDVFNEITINKVSVPSPEVKQVLESLFPEKLSQVFEMTAIMDSTTEKYEHFSFGFIMLEQQKGDVLDLETLIQEFKKDIKIEVNI